MRHITVNMDAEYRMVSARNRLHQKPEMDNKRSAYNADRKRLLYVIHAR